MKDDDTGDGGVQLTQLFKKMAMASCEKHQQEELVGKSCDNPKELKVAKDKWAGTVNEFKKACSPDS